MEVNGDLAQGYENGHIYGRLYNANNLPSSNEFLHDLKELLEIYKEIEYLIGNRTVDQFNDYLLLNDDRKFLEEDQEKETNFQLSAQSLVIKERMKDKNSLFEYKNIGGKLITQT